MPGPQDQHGSFAYEMTQHSAAARAVAVVAMHASRRRWRKRVQTVRFTGTPGPPIIRRHRRIHRVWSQCRSGRRPRRGPGFRTASTHTGRLGDKKLVTRSPPVRITTEGDARPRGHS